MTQTLGSRSASSGPTRSPASGWTAGERRVAAAVLVTCGLLWLGSELIGLGSDGATKFDRAATSPVLSGIAVSADLLSNAFFLGAVGCWLLLALKGSPRLAWTGGVLGVFGVVAQAALNGVDLMEYASATSGLVPYVLWNDLMDHISGPPIYVGMMMWFLGAFVGTAIAMVALWRSRALSRPSVALWVGFLLANLAEVPFPTVVGMASLTWMAVDILRSRHVSAIVEA
jgi:hypothetical protein